MSLRQLARQLRSHNLAGFWQGSTVLAPHIQEQNQQVLAGQQGPEDGDGLLSAGAGSAPLYQLSQTRAFAAVPAYAEHMDLSLAEEDLPLRESTSYSEASVQSSYGSEGLDAAQPPSGLSVSTIQAQDNITELLDDGSFVPLTPFEESADTAALSSFPADEALVTGRGKIEGRPVCVVSQIPATAEGSLSDRHSQQISHMMDHAIQAGIPVISLHDSSHEHSSDRSEASAPSTPSMTAHDHMHMEGCSQGGSMDVLQRHAEASGVVPQLALSIGRSSMQASMGFALADFAFSVRQPSKAHAWSSSHGPLQDEHAHGLDRSVDWAAVLLNRREALQHMRDLLSYLPLSNSLPLPKVLCTDPVDRFCPDLDCIIPDAGKAPYAVREVIQTIADDGCWHEIAPQMSRNIVTGFSRLGGMSVGIVANAPAVLSGCLDAAAACKAARFVRFCDAFNLPLITLVDAPGFLVPPADSTERAAAIRQAAQLLYAYAEATVPKLTVILRTADGPAYGMMGSKHLNADVNLAWPSARIGVRGPDGTRQLIFSARASLLSGSSRDRQGRAAAAGPEAPRIARPLAASQYGIVDAVIRPAMTRKHLCRELALLQGKQSKMPRRKHGTSPS